MAATSARRGARRDSLGLARVVYAVAAAAAALCAQGAAGAARADEPRAAIQGELEASLRTAIVRAVGETDRPIQNRFEARRRARAAAEDAIAVLRSEGYYAYQVEPEVGDDEDAPAPVVQVTPGPRFALTAPRIAWEGPRPDEITEAAADQALDLHPRAPARAADIVSAEGRAVAAVQKRGYADVTAQPREVVVDHADFSVQPTYRIAAGPLVRLDGLDLTNSGRTDRAWLRALAPWTSGEPYDPEDVAELERRLLDTGVYESVTVALAPTAQTTAEGLRPIVVSLAERKRRTLELGASYSTSEGAGLDARWTRYNVLGRADTLALIGRASRIDSRLQVDLTLPHWLRPQQTLRTAAAVYRLRTDAYDETGAGVRADVTRRYGKTSYVTVGASADLSRTYEISLGVLAPISRDVATLALLSDLALDRSDDPLNPKRGWKFSARAEPTLLVGDENLPYLKAQTQGSAYLPLGPQARTVLAGRVRLGSIVNGAIRDIPASRRFYAGGGGSVRGFGYQDVGPELADGTPQGGLSLLESSFEVRHDLSQRWGLAGFVDAGAVGTDHFPGVTELAIGVGAGVRYNLGFAPIRVDVAVPVSKRRDSAPFQLYVSIGQAF
ncbi:autotransporter assembly complex protein TamA [Phenylobacterium sp.]|uniref:autotransporter assembly complex protein TamA n=1 Tax=Phenylobacterium sp. TaxID=1871053 RepID=UPI0039831F0A